jgi:hypothetical protein
MPTQQTLKIKYSNKRNGFIKSFTKNANHFKMGNVWIYCSSELPTSQMHRMRNRKQFEVKELLAKSTNALCIRGLNQNDSVKVIAFDNKNHFHIDDMVILNFTPSFEGWAFNGLYHFPKCSDDIKWAETYTDAKGEQINVRYGILIQETEGLKAKDISYDREVWEGAVGNYMAQVQKDVEQELFKNVDAIVIDDDYVEPHYFALSNLGHFIENHLVKAVMA